MDSQPSELIISPPASEPPRKSPPLAFEPTSNDSLAPLISPSRTTLLNTDSLASLSPSRSPRSLMGLTSPQAPGSEQDLQLIVDQQNNAMQLLHEAFAAERQVWSLEKERLYQRIASLEQLLRNRDHYSPAKSPNLSPLSTGSVTSPRSRAISSAPRLPMIAEDENFQPLSLRRDGAPASIDLPGRPPLPGIMKDTTSRSQRASAVSFDGEFKVEEIPISPPTTARSLSPLPAGHRALAGHTPLKAPRPPTPPQQHQSMDGMDDTPTRNNTHINAFLTRSNDEDEDKELKGPLSMPELPNNPDETNFTLEALSKRLEQVARSPDESRPTIYAQPSPGMISPAELNPEAAKEDVSQRSTSVAASAVVSPNAVVELPHEVNGVKLKKKASTNFGAPFGSLGGFGGRKYS